MAVYKSSCVPGLIHVVEFATSRRRCYPCSQNGVAVAGGAGAWAYGNKTEIIPANGVAAAITNHYHVIFINIETLDDVATYQLKMYCGDDCCGSIKFIKSANKEPGSNIEISTPVIPRSSSFSVELASSTGNSNITLSVVYIGD